MASSISESSVEIDKNRSKTILTAFMNTWRFASKEESSLLEEYFSLLAYANFFDSVSKPFLKLLLTSYKNASVKWLGLCSVVISRVYRLFRMCCIMFSSPQPDLAESVLETKVLCYFVLPIVVDQTYGGNC